MSLSLKHLFLALALVVSLSSIACECIGVSTVSQATADSKMIFSGRILSVLTTSNFDSLGIETVSDTSKWAGYNKQWLKMVVVKIKTERLYKGVSFSDTITVFTLASNCGTAFKPGQKYIVYAYKEAGNSLSSDFLKFVSPSTALWTYACHRTRIWDQTEEFAILNALK